jgi:hypothetical protein
VNAEQAASIDYADGRTRYWAERAERVREHSTTLAGQYREIAEVWKGIAVDLRKPPPEPREDRMDDWLSEARAVAERLGEDGRLVTVNDVRDQCPPPPDVDPRVMGALLRKPQWELVNYVRSTRSTCHGRPVGQFRRNVG